MNMNISSFAGIILAGGNSTRMGKNKYGLVVKGETMLERTIRILDPFVSQIIIVLKAFERETPHTFTNKKIVAAYDSVSNRGPLQGIVDGVACMDDRIKYVFLLTCDLPYLTGDWLLKLKNEYFEQSVDGVITSVDNFTNPLIALYHKKVIDNSQVLIDSGIKRPLDLWDGFNIQPLEIDKENQLVVQDMNTPEAYQKACLFYKQLDLKNE